MAKKKKKWTVKKVRIGFTAVSPCGMHERRYAGRGSKFKAETYAEIKNELSLAAK